VTDADHLAKEAGRLKNDETFIKALADIRSDTLNELARANADDKIAILRLQQRAAVIDEIHDVLGRYIMLADKPATDEKSPFA
jgi:hypothetical protein